MKNEFNWKKLLLPIGAVGLLGVICVTENAGITNIRQKNYGIVLDYTLEARRGLPSKEERIYGVSQIWKKASDFYGAWELADTEISWDEAYKIACEEAGNAKTTLEYMRALEKFMAHLNHGNSESVGGPNLSAGLAVLPFKLRFYSNEFVVTATEDSNTYPIGTVVESVNGVKTGMYLEDVYGEYSGHHTPGARAISLANLMYFGNVGEQLKLVIRRPGDSETESVIVCWDKNNWLDYNETKQMHLETEGRVLHKSEAFEVIQVDEGIVCLRLKSEMELSYLDTYFAEIAPILARYDGVVLDMRYCEAANSLISHTIVESFFGEAIPYCEEGPAMIKVSNYVSNYGAWDYWLGMEEDSPYAQFVEVMDQMDELISEENAAMIEFGKEMHSGRFEAGEEIEALIEEQWKERYPAVALDAYSDTYKEQVESCGLKGKPVVMIVDKLTGGSLDSTAAEAKSVGMTLVGTGTRGATGTLMLIDLSGGWMTGISTQRGLTPEGVDITNKGVEAQIQVDLTAEDVASGHDSQMEKAVEVVREMIEK